MSSDSHNTHKSITACKSFAAADAVVTSAFVAADAVVTAAHIAGDAAVTAQQLVITNLLDGRLDTIEAVDYGTQAELDTEKARITALEATDASHGTLHTQHAAALATKQPLLDTALLYQDTGNNFIGIGTASPAYHLHIQDSGDPSVKIERGSNNFLMLNETHFMIVKPVGAQFDFNLHGYTNDMVFKTNNTERIRLSAGGAVNFSTVAPLIVNASQVNFSNLPTSDSGLSAGDLYRDSNYFIKMAIGI